MKKFFALALAILMMAAIAVPAFAAEFNPIPDYTNFDPVAQWEETRYGQGNDASGDASYLVDANASEQENTKIEYGVAQAYTVTIPAEIHLHEFTADSTTNQTKGYVYGIEKIGVSDVVIAGDEELNIYLSSSQWDSSKKEWALKDSEGTRKSADVNYKIVAADIAVDGEGNDVVDATKYIANYAAARDDLIFSGTQATDENALILNQACATGNVSTVGSAKNVFLYFSSKGTAQEGTFRDVLTFTVRIETVVAQGN